MPTLDKQKENAKKRLEIAKDKFTAKQYEQMYRAVDNSHNSKKRRSPTIEFQGEDEQLSNHHRLKAIAKTRDIYRNYTGAKALELQLKLNVIGNGAKIIVHNKKDEARSKEYTEWFNGWFAKNCDGRNTRHLNDQAAIAFQTVIREGDVLVYFDHDGIVPMGNGKLWYWEADQIVSLAEKTFKKEYDNIKQKLNVPKELKLKQNNGIITDQYGRNLAYIVTSSHATYGKATIKNIDDVTILPVENSMLLYNPWRINQKRGISEELQNANSWADLERFTESMQQRSILQSFLAFEVRKRDGIIQGRDRITDTDNVSTPSLTSDDADEGATNYRNFEKFSQNAIEYMEPDEEIASHQLAGDLPDAQQFIDFMLGQSGWSMGLSRMYATGKADASYSASMAESNMSWNMFEWWQKWIERYFYDWVAKHAFKWAVKTNRLPTMVAHKYSWQGWPTRKAINPAQESNARKTDLEIGAKNYEDILGANWKEKLKSLGEQIQYSRDNGLFVPLFQPQTGNS